MLTSPIFTVARATRRSSCVLPSKIRSALVFIFPPCEFWVVKGPLTAARGSTPPRSGLRLVGFLGSVRHRVVKSPPDVAPDLVEHSLSLIREQPSSLRHKRPQLVTESSSD